MATSEDCGWPPARTSTWPLTHPTSEAPITSEATTATDVPEQAVSDHVFDVADDGFP